MIAPADASTERLIGLAIDVRLHTGPGLLLNFNAPRLADDLRRDAM